MTVSEASRNRSQIRLAGLAIGVFVLIGLLASIVHIPSGSVGLVRPVFGGADASVRTLGSGWHLVPRLLNKVERFESGERTLIFGAGPAQAGEGNNGEPNLAWTISFGSGMEAAGALEYSLDEGALRETLEVSQGDLDGFMRDRLADAFRAVTDDQRFMPPQPSHREAIRELALAHLRGDASGIGSTGRAYLSIRLDRIGLSGSDALLGYPQATRNPKLLWLCVDSFDWNVIDPLISRGRMPRMAQLKSDGAWGTLQTITPVLSPVVWTSMATGMLPEKHGIFDFIATDPSTGAVVPVTSSLRKTDAFWNILGHSGVSVGVVAWWATFPAERVNGFMATDRIAYQLFKDKISDTSSDDPLKTFPSELYSDVKPLIVPPAAIDDAALQPFLDYRTIQDSFSKDDRDRVNELRTVLAATETYRAIATELFSAIETDVRVLYFEAPDTTSHLFMPFVPPTRNVDAQHMEWFGRIVPEMYAHQDAWIGEMIDRFADEETTVLITSDHGFRTGDERPESDARIGEGKAAEWHTRDGVFLIAGPDIVRGERVLGASILDVLPTVLALYGLPPADDMDGKVLRTVFRQEYVAQLSQATILTYNLAPREPGVPDGGLSPEEAEEHLAKLRALGYIKQSAPTADVNRGTAALAAGDFEQAIEAFRGVLAQGEKTSVRLSLSRALRLAERYDEAEVELRRVLASGDEAAVVHTEWSALERNRGDLDRAEREVDAALAVDARFVDAHMQRAKLAEVREDWDRAIESYRTVLDIDPQKADALNQIGVLLQRRGRIDEAIVAMQEAIEKNPDLAAPYNNLGLLFLAQNKLDRAIEVIELGLTMRPDSPILLNSLGTLQYETGATETAIRSFEAALDADPHYAESISNLAIVYQGLKNAPKAMIWWSRLIEVEPENGDARVSLALIQVRQGELEDAATTLEQSVAALPDHVHSLIALGSTYNALGRKNDARAAFERALRIDPDQPRVRTMLAGLGP